MEVVVIEVNDAGVQVRAHLDGSYWRGVWRGPTTPSLGLYQVELEVPDPMRWTDRHVVTGTTPDGNRVRGVVEAAESDGVLTLRVNGGLVLVEVPEPLPAVGQALRLEDVALAFFPC